MTDFKQVKVDAHAQWQSERQKKRNKNQARRERALRDGLSKRCPACLRVKSYAAFAEDHGRGRGAAPGQTLLYPPTIYDRCNRCRQQNRYPKSGS